MNTRATRLISSLQLVPHPEGGHFREIHRSTSLVKPDDARGERASLTTIFFLLAAGEVSRWHRVASDEVWHFYEGEPLELFTADADLGRITQQMLGPVAEAARPVQIVPADRWQAARSTGAYTLVGCTVGPGFEFEDFQMLADSPETAKAMRHRHPELAHFL